MVEPGRMCIARVVRPVLLANHAIVLALLGAALIIPEYPAWAWLAILPMVLSGPGLLRSQTHTYRWLMMALALPLALGLMEVIANPALRVWSAALVFFTGTQFFCLALILRITNRA